MNGASLYISKQELSTVVGEHDMTDSHLIEVIGIRGLRYFVESIEEEVRSQHG